MENYCNRLHRKVSWVWIGIPLVVPLLFGLVMIRSCTRFWDTAHGVDAKMKRGYASLKLGMSAKEVFQRMDKAPISTNTTFTLGQVLGNEAAYREGARANGEIFYTWVTGVDTFYCVGFDTNGKMVVKGKGGT